MLPVFCFCAFWVSGLVVLTLFGKFFLAFRVPFGQVFVLRIVTGFC